MNPPNEKLPGAQRMRQPFGRRVGPARSLKPVTAGLKKDAPPNSPRATAPAAYHTQRAARTAQTKTSNRAQMPQPAVAPKVFRPPTPRMQPRIASGQGNRKTLAASSVYNPQPPPKVLQTKSAIAAASHVAQGPRQPLAPAVYHPEVKKIVQPKTIWPQRKTPVAPPVYRPAQRGFAQPKMAAAKTSPVPPKAPPVYRPQPKVGAQAKLRAQVKSGMARSRVSPSQSLRQPIQSQTYRTEQRGPLSKLPIQPQRAELVRARSPITGAPIFVRIDRRPSGRQAFLQMKMPSLAARLQRPTITLSRAGAAGLNQIIQRKVGFEFELGYIKTQKDVSFSPFSESWTKHERGEVILHRPGYDVTADVSDDGGSQIEFVLTEVDENTTAGKQQIVRAAEDVLADIRNLCKVEGQWFPGKTFWNNSPSGHRFQALWGFDKQVGQLQMTGGIAIESLGHIVSGSAGDVTGAFHMKAEQFLGNYKSGNAQPAWRCALAAVQTYFGTLPPEHQKVLAGVVAMIAQVPLSMHGHASSLGGQGMFTAKTDYSTILLETVYYLQAPLAPVPFVKAVMQTINDTIAHGLEPERKLSHADGVFPENYEVNRVRLGGVLSIENWLRGMLPNGRKGIDYLTPEDFPGSNAQKKEMRAFGRFGSKTDPGHRPIVEWRNISACYPDDLPDLVGDLVDYLRFANQQNPWHLQSHLDTSTLTEFPRLSGE